MRFLSLELRGKKMLYLWCLKYLRVEDDLASIYYLIASIVLTVSLCIFVR